VPILIIMPSKKGGDGGTGKGERSRDRGIPIKTRQPQTTTNDIQITTNLPASLFHL